MIEIRPDKDVEKVVEEDSGPKSVVLVGRPNVGKSSLFNALLGYRRTIVSDEAGTTLDFVREPLRSCGGRVELVDAQGIWDEGDEKALKRALEIADAVLFVVDAGAGTTPFDRWIATRLHSSKLKTLLVANKQDVTNAATPQEFAELGFPDMLGVSVAHRRGLDDVEDWLSALSGVFEEEVLPPLEENYGEEEDEKEDVTPTAPEVLQLAIIGRPNVGKSTLMNLLCGEEVSRVSPIAHTTRDAVSFVLETPRGTVRLLDTAGMRRPRSTKQEIEEYAGRFARRAIARAHVVLVVLPLHEQLVDQDMRLLDLVKKSGKPVALLYNFCDLVPERQRQKTVEASDFSGALGEHWRIFVSGKSGENVERILPLAFRLRRDTKKRVKTSELNRFVEELKLRNPPPTRGQKAFNLLYASQVSTAPPTFVFFMNRQERLPEHYQRYVENALRERLSLKGQPIRVKFRGNDRTKQRNFNPE